MTDLIKQVGGIEKAIDILAKAPDDCDAYETETHVIELDDLHTAIAKHDLKQCQHGYDIACLICGFGTENGVRVWRKQIESDEVTDIRNHVSPSTIVKDLEAERHG